MQIGLNIAGGVASFDGEVTTLTDEEVPFLRPNGTVGFQTRHDEETSPASEEFFKAFPLLKVEAEAAAILVPAFKLKFAGGLNFPGTGFRVLATYLIGAR